MDANDTNKIIYPELSYKITGLCFQLQKQIGRFCREIQYSNELEKLLEENKIKFIKENSLKMSPKGNRPDFIIENKIIIDLKAKSFITKDDYNQMQRYLKSSNLKLGMIINFRSFYLKPKRIINSEYSSHSHDDSHYSHR